MEEGCLLIMVWISLRGTLASSLLEGSVQLTSGASFESSKGQLLLRDQAIQGSLKDLSSDGSNYASL